MELPSDAGLEQFRAKRDKICAKKWNEVPYHVELISILDN